MLERKMEIQVGAYSGIIISNASSDCAPMTVASIGMCLFVLSSCPPFSLPPSLLSSKQVINLLCRDFLHWFWFLG